MGKRRYDNVYEILPSITGVVVAVVMSRCLRMGFWETFLSGVLAGIVLLLASAIIKSFNKKKLYIIITTETVERDRFRVSVLLWNNSQIREIYGTDYGEHGFGLITDYGTIIDKLGKPNGTGVARNFTFSRIPHTSENSLSLLMDSIPAKGFIEFDFEVISPKNISNTAIIIPESAAVNATDTLKAPNVSLHYDRSNLHVYELKYNKKLQIFHWLCRFAALSAIAATTMSYLLLGHVSEIIILGTSLFATLTMISINTGDFIPPFIVRHLKQKTLNRNNLK